VPSARIFFLPRLLSNEGRSSLVKDAMRYHYEIPFLTSDQSVGLTPLISILSISTRFRSGNQRKIQSVYYCQMLYFTNRITLASSKVGYTRVLSIILCHIPHLDILKQTQYHALMSHQDLQLSNHPSLRTTWCTIST
jgi:hypothetical protein